MDPYLILTLQWRGLFLKPQQMWELLELKSTEVPDYLRNQNKKVPLNWAKQGAAELELLQRAGADFLPFWHPHYPEDLKHLECPPWIISFVGDSSQLIRPGLSVVGSRRLSPLGADWMESEFLKFLKNCEVNVLSGGAFGVDQLAHKLSILAGRPSLCWLPSGILRPYPSAIKSLIQDLVDGGGGAFSTFSPQENMRKHYFHWRNRVLACLGRLTFIVEARRRSGTLITAKAALEYGRDLAVLPSSPLQHGLGGLDLIHAGANMIRDAEDLTSLMSSCKGAGATGNHQKEGKVGLETKQPKL